MNFIESGSKLRDFFQTAGDIKIFNDLDYTVNKIREFWNYELLFFTHI